MQGGLRLAHEVAQQLLDAVIDENVPPIDLQHRRNAHAAEKELLLREFLHVEQFAHDFVGVAQQLDQRFGIAQAAFFDKGAHGLLHRQAVFHDAQRHEGVQIDPDRLRVDQRDAAEGHPAAGLAPDHAADDVLRVLQLVRIALVFPAGEARILAAAFVLTPCLQLDDLRHVGAEEVRVQRQVAEEVGLAVLHRDDQRRALQAFEHAGEGATMPHQITDAIRAHRPGAENEAP